MLNTYSPLKTSLSDSEDKTYNYSLWENVDQNWLTSQVTFKNKNYLFSIFYSFDVQSYFQ